MRALSAEEIQGPGAVDASTDGTKDLNAVTKPCTGHRGVQHRAL
jgi:hypothetical protein